MGFIYPFWLKEQINIVYLYAKIVTVRKKEFSFFRFLIQMLRQIFLSRLKNYMQKLRPLRRALITTL